MPTMRDVSILREEVIAQLPNDRPVPYKQFLAQLDENGLSEGKAQIEGMKATGMVDRWLQVGATGLLEHVIARPGLRGEQV